MGTISWMHVGVEVEGGCGQLSLKEPWYNNRDNKYSITRV